MGLRRSAIGLLAMFWLFCGCAGLQDWIQTPRITFDRVTPDKMTLLSGAFVFHFTIDNPNPVGLPLGEINYDLTVNGRRLVSGRLDRGFNLPAAGSAPLAIPVALDYLAVFDSLAQLHQSDQIRYGLRGSAAVGPLHIPFSQSGRLDLPRLPKIRIEGLRVQRLDFSGARLQMTLGLENSNDFALTMDGLEYALRLGGSAPLQGTIEDPAPLAANGRTRMALKLRLNFTALGRSAQALLAGNTADSRLTGNLLVNRPGGTERIPFAFDGQVPLMR